MKIKMVTCAVSNDLLIYNAGSEFTVGKDITSKMANDFVNANFAIVTEQDMEEKPIKPKRGKKNEV